MNLTENLENMPKLYSTEKTAAKDKMVVAKFFNPTGRSTWYGVEYDPEQKLMFGYVVGEMGPDCDEWGYWNMNELQSVKGQFGLGIERDLYWTPKKMSEVG